MTQGYGTFVLFLPVSVRGIALVETANHRGGAAFINPGRLRAGYYCAP